MSELIGITAIINLPEIILRLWDKIFPRISKDTRDRAADYFKDIALCLEKIIKAIDDKDINKAEMYCEELKEYSRSLINRNNVFAFTEVLKILYNQDKEYITMINNLQKQPNLKLIAIEIRKNEIKNIWRIGGNKNERRKFEDIMSKLRKGVAEYNALSNKIKTIKIERRIYP